MSVEEQNKAAIVAWIDALNRRDMEHFDKIDHPDFFDHNAPPGQPNGREALREALNQVLAAFPDARETNHDMIAEGDKVVTRWSTTGTHAAEFMGVPPTDMGVPPTERKVTVSGTHIYRMENRQLREVWRSDYMADLFRQLGAEPLNAT